MKKSELFKKTAAALLLARDYSWGSSNRCSVGFLIATARGARATGAEFRQGGQSRMHPCQCALWCATGADNHVVRWLASEFGLTRRELESVELLNDPGLIRQLANRGIRPAPMFNRSRRYVAAYLMAMSAQAGRRERKSTARIVEAAA